MNKNKVLTKVYSSSATIIVAIVLLICLIYNWPALAVVIAVAVSVVLSAPALISLQVLLWLSERIQIEKSFAWILLLASIPPLAFIAAWLFADLVPGKTWFLLLLGMLSGYVGILTHGISVSQFFNSNSK